MRQWCSSAMMPIVVKRECLVGKEINRSKAQADCVSAGGGKLIVVAVVLAVVVLITAAIALTTCGKSDDSAKSEDAKQVSATTEQSASDKSDAQSNGQKTTRGGRTRSHQLARVNLVDRALRQEAPDPVAARTMGPLTMWWTLAPLPAAMAVLPIRATISRRRKAPAAVLLRVAMVGLITRVPAIRVMAE